MKHRDLTFTIGAIPVDLAPWKVYLLACEGPYPFVRDDGLTVVEFESHILQLSCPEWIAEKCEEIANVRAERARLNRRTDHLLTFRSSRERLAQLKRDGVRPIIWERKLNDHRTYVRYMLNRDKHFPTGIISAEPRP